MALGAPVDPPKEIFVYLSRLGWGVIKSFCLLFFLGIALAVAPTWISKYHDMFKSGSYETNILLAVSSSLIASAILTVTLSRAEAKQRKQDSDEMLASLRKDAEATISELRLSSVDSLVKELAGDKTIFEEVNAHIFRKDYVRTDYRARIRLAWLGGDDQDQNHLKKESEITYTVKNISSTRATVFPFSFIEEDDSACNFKGYPSVECISYHFEGASRIVLENEDLESVLTRDSPKGFPRVSFSRNLKIPAGKSVRCGIKFITVVDAKGSHPIVSLSSTTDMIIDIDDHPGNLVVEAQLFHPVVDKLKVITNAPHAKCWRVYGILPGQGIQLSWRKATQSGE
jgi:hypothetical protein